MGDSKKWGEGLPASLTALPIEVKFVIGLGLALSTILPAGLITAGIMSLTPLLPEGEYQTVHCGDRSTEIRRDDPVWDKPDSEGAQEMCDRAWGRS